MFARLTIDEMMVNIATRNMFKNRFVWLLVVLVIYNGINASNRSFFTGTGISYNIDFCDGPEYIENHLIGDLLLGYTIKSQQAELSLHFGFDFLNGIDVHNHSRTKTIIDTMSDLSLIYTDYYGSCKDKTVRCQLAISSDIYFGKFFSRVQPQFYFEYESSYLKENYKYSTDKYIAPYDSSYRHPFNEGLGFYSGFLLGFGYKWKKIKILIYNANLCCIGVNIEYIFYEKIRKKLSK